MVDTLVSIKYIFHWYFDLYFSDGYDVRHLFTCSMTISGHYFLFGGRNVYADFCLL
jgi:hypothetical protein